MPIPSLFTGSGALTTQQRAIDVVANNIANVNTTGFKASQVHFSEAINNTVKPSSSAGRTFGGTNPQSIGTGMRISDINTIFSQGSLKSTGLASDLALSGSGFFVVSGATEDDAATIVSPSYTRDGHFLVDAEQHLVNANGDKVIGATLYNSQNGDIKHIAGYTAVTYFSDQNVGTTIVPTDGGAAPNLPVPTPTTTVLGGGAAPAFDATRIQEISVRGGLVDSNTNVTDGTLQLSREQGGKLRFTYVDGAAGTFVASVSTDSQFLDSVISIEMANGANKVQLRIRLEPGVTSLEQVFSGIDYDSATNNTDTLTFGDAASTASSQTGTDITAGNDDFQYMSLTDLQTLYSPIRIPNFFYTTDPLLEIETANFSIEGDGTVSVFGPASEELKLGRLLVTNFVNPDGLVNEGNNKFEESSNSGVPATSVIGGPFDKNAPSITGTKIVSGSLEASNVNLASEFANLIGFQRGLQANSRVISSSDEILQTIINL